MTQQELFRLAVQTMVDDEVEGPRVILGLLSLEAFAAAIREQALEESAPKEPNSDEVICPQCCHQFRAIPVNVQKLMLDAGFEPPFKAAPKVETK